MRELPQSVVLVSGVLLLVVAGCRSERACLGLRQQGFEIINEPHPCADDSDCRTSVWPTCGKPLNAESDARLRALEKRSDAEGCSARTRDCRVERPAHCDRNLCIVRPVPLAP